jgi:hypothetical protein
MRVPGGGPGKVISQPRPQRTTKADPPPPSSAAGVRPGPANSNARQHCTSGMCTTTTIDSTLLPETSHRSLGSTGVTNVMASYS